MTHFSPRAARYLAVTCLVTLLLACGMTVPLATAVGETATTAVSYEQDVRPIFRAHCMSCHNAQDRKGGLALDTYAATMEGGSSGEVVFAAELESSRLWALVSHEEEPVMPPAQDKMAADKLDVIRRWIEDGTVELPGGKAKPQTAKPAWQFEAATTDAAAAGPLPETALWQPVTITARAAAVTAIAASPNAPLLAVAGQRQVVLYHAESAELLGVLAFPEGTAHALRFSADGNLLLAAGGRGGAQGLVALYDVRTGTRVTALGDELDVVLAADITPDLQLVAMGGPARVVRVLATQSGELRYELTKHTDWICALEFSPDGNYLATADRAGGLRVWEATTGREYQDLPGHKGAVTAVSWRADSNVLASSSEDGSIRLWTIDDAKTIRTWTAHAGGVAAVQFCRDGRLVSAGRDAHVRLWDAAGKPLQAFGPTADIALAACVTNSGSCVAGGDFTGSVKLWESADGTAKAALLPNPPLLETQLDTARQRVQTLTARLEELTLAATAAQTPYDALRENCQSQLARLSQLWSASRQTADAVRELNRRLARDEEADADAAHARLWKLQAKLQEQQQQALAAELALGELVKQREPLAADVRSALTALTEMQLQLQQALARRQIATARLHEFLIRPAVLRSDLALAEQRLALLQEELAAAQLEHSRLSSNFGPAEEQASLEQDQQAAEERVAVAAADVSEAEQQLITARDRWLFFRQAYAEAQEEGEGPLARP